MHHADDRASRLELRRARRLLDARAPRGDPAPGRLAAAPDVLPVAGLPAAGAVAHLARLALHVTRRPRGGRGAQPPVAVDDHADRVEADRRALSARLRGASRSQAAARRRSRARWRARSRAAAAPGRRRDAPPARGAHARVLTSTNTSVRPSKAIRSISPCRGAHVAREHAEAEALEVGRRQVLAEPPERAASVGLRRTVVPWRTVVLWRTVVPRRRGAVGVQGRSRYRRHARALAPFPGRGLDWLQTSPFARTRLCGRSSTSGLITVRRPARRECIDLVEDLETATPTRRE